MFLSQDEKVSRFPILRAIAMREDTLGYYKAGRRVETWTPKKGRDLAYTQVRRCENGRPNAKYLGDIDSFIDWKQENW